MLFRRSPPKEQITTLPILKDPASSSSSDWPIPIRRLAFSKSKTDSGASVARSSTGPSFLGLREPDSRLDGSAWGAYNASFSQRPGWGTPAWSTPPLSDSDSSSPSQSSFGLSFGPATFLPSFSQPNDAGVAVNGESFITVYPFLSLLTSPFF